MTPYYIIRREDGTYEIEKNGYPYHVVQEDALYDGIAAAFPSLPSDRAALRKPDAAAAVENEPEGEPIHPENYTLVENHRGKWGWMGEEQAQIEDFGPLPDGWTEEAPAKVQYLAALAKIQLRYEGEGGLLKDKLMEIQAAVALDIGVEEARAEYAALLAAYNGEIEALEAEYV